ncbi:hypothetical protein GRI89_05900 [Altererythrobacter salegens]|uniref:DUF2029 domain-containing protein n=1 Tax=Croceibacterium salegens TaxID=1737568 RepID=A0A6I4SSU6_9SPHN|nr:hypothetical protein [Croceibacterium salegens]MXO59071.1 hypothetical protein [Croceibacterium salegens]
MEPGGTPQWHRFAHWPRGAARAALAAIVVLLLWAFLSAPLPLPQTPVNGANRTASAVTAKRDTDLALYDRVSERVVAGDPYYKAAVEEQRARNFPVRPAVAVRLPTLAFLTGLMGGEAEGVILLLAVIAAATWYVRLAAEPGGDPRKVIGVACLIIGMASGLNPKYLVLHEVWAGLLVALAIGVHRPGKWGWALLAAGGALAIREHVLPFVLLLGAMAAWRRDWREAGAWGALVLAFLGYMAWHFSKVDPLLLPGDRPSDGWLALRGMRGLTGNVVETSPLQFLPALIAAPLALLPLVGWTGWKSPLGTFCTLLCAGYGLFFMIAGRDNNFYWALVVTPVWFAGLAFLPLTLGSLWRRAFAR